MTRAALLLTTGLVLITGGAFAFAANAPGRSSWSSKATGVAVLRVGRAKLLIDLGKHDNKPRGVGNLSKNKKALFVPWAGWFAGIDIFSCSRFACRFSDTSVAMPILGDGKAHTKILIPLNQGTGEDDVVSVSLNSDNAGLPGAVIVGGSVVPSNSSDCCAIESVTIPSTTLTKGLPYWIVASRSTCDNEHSAWDVQDSDEVIADNANKMAISTAQGKCLDEKFITTQSSGWALFNPGDHGEPAQWTPAAALK